MRVEYFLVVEGFRDLRRGERRVDIGDAQELSAHYEEPLGRK